ncbi:hypothetical protein CWS_01680 [Buchnera aphidicola str. JF99 (Acyrthosiphon pisum)]|nr:hypothetical protein CWO_01690 [Buchnera aphidicola str. LL01 (Acyrthosiphon pisum)]ADP66715.1 hypothetical protein CWQ_01720 [Buchnera aphidicola str. TLW03 (Acyrthosiphon pisum)]ADP67297.1 hypothetical protein CWS_01680 [Buchnera aphidicola str. JF99 (Acyrthosiphon pisum)]ADP67817.1 hypothetical protein CWU_02110 [Buchnera aphidicola str. JF98 (Acyrthosiphon pisum)]
MYRFIISRRLKIFLIKKGHVNEYIFEELIYEVSIYFKIIINNKCI